MLKNIDCGYSLEPPRQCGSNEYQNLCFEQKYEKYQSFLSENFQFLEVKFSIYLNKRVFVMGLLKGAGLKPVLLNEMKIEVSVSLRLFIRQVCGLSDCIRPLATVTEIPE